MTLSRAVWAAGAVLLLGGTGHSVGVLHKFATVGVPDGHRVVFLAFVAYVHFTAGALDLVAARAFRRGEASARAILGVSAGLLLAYGASVSPLLVHSGTVFRIMPVLYPVVHLGLLAASRREAVA